MKRKVAFTAAVIVLAMAGFLLPAITSAPSSTVGACGWALQSTKSVITPDGNAQLWLQNYYDGCHHHYYQAQIKDREASSITDTMHIRVWVCGTYQGDVYWNDTVPGFGVVTHTTGVYTYGATCGAQADNYDTYIRTPTVYHNPTTYLNF